MKKFIKNNLKIVVAVIITAIIFTGLGIYAETKLSADKVTYSGDVTVKDKIDDLYTKANVKDVVSAKICKFIDGTYGSYGNIGSKYECYVNDTDKYNFYILAINTNTIDLIMERNITDYDINKTVAWQTAVNYFKNGVGSNLGWNIDVDLPSIEKILNAIDYTNWNITENNDNDYFCLQDKSNGACTSSGNYGWLYNYTRECSTCVNSLDSSFAGGYWTKSISAKYDEAGIKAWFITRSGTIRANQELTRNDYSGVRPVITVLKSNLYSE